MSRSHRVAIMTSAWRARNICLEVENSYICAKLSTTMAHQIRFSNQRFACKWLTIQLTHSFIIFSPRHHSIKNLYATHKVRSRLLSNFPAISPLFNPSVVPKKTRRKRKQLKRLCFLSIVNFTWTGGNFFLRMTNVAKPDDTYRMQSC